MPAAAAEAAGFIGSNIGPIASAAGAIGGGLLQGGAASNASKAAQQAAANSLAFTKQVYGDTKGNVQPTITQGVDAGNALNGLLGIGGNPAASDAAFKNYLGSTNYGFQLDQGEKGIQSANAASFNSGATAKALNSYAQGQAGNALAGYEGLLTGEQSLGTQAALGLGGIGTGTSQQVAGINQAAAGAEGSASVYGANAGQNALAGLASLANKQATSSSFGGGGSSGALNSAISGWNG